MGIKHEAFVAEEEKGAEGLDVCVEPRVGDTLSHLEGGEDLCDKDAILDVIRDVEVGKGLVRDILGSEYLSNVCHDRVVLVVAPCGSVVVVGRGPSPIE